MERLSCEGYCLVREVRFEDDTLKLRAIATGSLVLIPYFFAGMDLAPMIPVLLPGQKSCT